jgi:hypothetical protein
MDKNILNSIRILEGDVMTCVASFRVFTLNNYLCLKISIKINKNRIKVEL